MSPFVASGSVNALAVAADERASAVPDVPTVAGLPDFKVSTWTGLFTTKNTPQAVIAKLQNAIDDSLNDGGVQQRLAKFGATVPKAEERGGEHMQKLVGTEIDRWISILKNAGVTPQ